MKSSVDDEPDARLGFAFDGFVLDPLRRQLRSADGSVIALTPRVFDALLYFVERPGELLDRDALMQALWPGLVVEENNLSQTLSALRRALGDEQRDRYVLTVPRRGFRFICAVRRVPLQGDEPQRVEVAAEEPVAEVAAAVPVTAVAAATTTALAAPPRRHRALFPAALLGVALLAAVLASWWWHHAPNRAVDAPATTLAVLPFRPLLAEHRDEILELGMADSLIVRVSPTPGLVVRSIGSARRFAGADQDAVAAARELDVQWIVQGTIQRWGDRVRVSARLLRASDGVASWSGSFDERFDDVFRVQDEIAERVARLLIPRLATAAVPADAAGTRDADAYQAFLTGRYHAQGIRPSGLAKSIELYERAIARDPGYALAHAALADSLRRLTVGADALPGPTLTRARAAAERAIAIDPRGAEGHAALGWVLWWRDWDWAAAEAALRRAVALNPNHAEAHLGLGHLLLSQGRNPDEGLSEMRRARELDPLSRITNALEASYLIAHGRRDEGLARVTKALEIDPDFWPAQLLLANVHLAAGDAAKAIDAAQRAERLSEGSTQATARLASLLARAGRGDEGRAVLARLVDRSRDRYVPPTMLAEAHCALGEREPALNALEQAYGVRDIHLAFVRITPCFDTLRGEPRFDRLLRKLAMPAGVASGGKLSRARQIR